MAGPVMGGHGAPWGNGGECSASAQWGRGLELRHGRDSEGPATPEGRRAREDRIDGRRYLAGRTWICMKLPWALVPWMRICVPVFGTMTLPHGLIGS